MTAVYRMPSLGADMEAGTLIEWVKQPGERLAKGDVIAVVETQKGAIEVEVFHDGVMGRRLVEVGETVPVGTPMAELEVEGAPPEAAKAAGGEAPPVPSKIQRTAEDQIEPRRDPRSGRPAPPRRGPPDAAVPPRPRAGWHAIWACRWTI